MSNNVNITIHDFNNICRTCLCSEDLKPLYEKCYESKCLVDMLMSCTFVKFTEDDCLPVKICTNCIHEINQSFLFAKRCETADIILCKCIQMFETELATNNLSQSVASIIKAEEEMKIESKPEIIPHTVDEVLRDCEFIEEEDVKIELKPEIFFPKIHQTEEVKQEVKIECEEYVKEENDPLNIANEFDETYDDHADESYEEDNDEDHDERNFEKSDYSGSRRKHKVSLDSQSKVHGTVFRKLKYFKKRELIHTPKIRHICSICSKTFTQFKNLKRHMGIHSGEKPYICEVCSKAFNQPTSLNYHMRTHTGEKPFMCGVCSRAFSQISHLNVHMRIHTGEKPHICGVCRKAFTQSYSLKRHMRTHI